MKKINTSGYHPHRDGLVITMIEHAQESLKKQYECHSVKVKINATCGQADKFHSLQPKPNVNVCQIHH